MSRRRRKPTSFKLTPEQALGLGLDQDIIEASLASGALKRFNGSMLQDHLGKRFLGTTYWNPSSSIYKEGGARFNLFPKVICSTCGRSCYVNEIVDLLNEEYRSIGDMVSGSEVLWNKARKQYSCPGCNHEGWLVPTTTCTEVQEGE